MPRNTVDDCMFCAPEPCGCKGTKKTAPARKVTKVARPPSAVPENTVPSSVTAELTQPTDEASRAVVEQPPQPAPAKRAGLRAIRSLAKPIERPRLPTRNKSTDPQSVDAPIDSTSGRNQEDVWVDALLCFWNAGLIDDEELLRQERELKLQTKTLRASIWRRKVHDRSKG